MNNTRLGAEAARHAAATVARGGQGYALAPHVAFAHHWQREHTGCSEAGR